RGNQSRTRARIQVFSAVLEDKADPEAVTSGHERYYGVLLLRSCNRNFAIFDSKVLESHQVNPEGLLTLTDPNYMGHVLSIPVEDEVLILPWLIDVYSSLSFTDNDQQDLWNAHQDSMDKLICRTIKCLSCYDLHVTFAVYHDPVETHLDVYFVGLDSVEVGALLRVHGIVTTSNTVLPANSMSETILFHKSSGECVSLEPGKSVPLPLSRRMTVLPRQSTLRVHVNIQVYVGHEAEFGIKETVEFNPSSDCAEEFIFLPNHGTLLVKATWVECEVRLLI
ncbi:rRNA N-glycosidase, partial [Rhynchospora pubera]